MRPDGRSPSTPTHGHRPVTARARPVAAFFSDAAVLAFLGLCFSVPLLWVGVASGLEPPVSKPTAATPASDTLRLEPGMSASAARAYAKTDAMIRRLEQPGVAESMLKLLVPVVRKQRHPLLVGRLVVAAAAVASGERGRERVDQLLADAVERPDDVVANFVAGGAVHYRGHVRATSRAEKSDNYRLAIRHLEPLREELKTAPRLWIYLAVSYLRTGRQADAEAAIERAIAADSGSDADVYYCRAEVHHRADPRAAMADIDRYIAIMSRNVQHGAWSAPEKEKKVLQMRAHLAAVAAGTAEPSGLELFDPIRDPRPEPVDGALFKSAWMVIGGAALLVALLWLRRLLSRRRKLQR